jgi:sugar O-acyltransferase (sialic acid O-acetyltransferase NeuD family)
VKPHYDILGKSNYALAVIFDILHLLHPDGCSVTIVANIPDTQNTSAKWGFEVKGVDYASIDTTEYHPNPATSKLLGSIGKSRRAIVGHFKETHGIQNEEYVTLIHPSAVIGQHVQIGYGTHIGPGAIIAPYAIISSFCVVNRSVSIGHHTQLDAFTCLNPGVHVAGICHLEEDVTIGMSAAILEGIHIGKKSVIGAGSVVTKDMPAGVVAYGVPAKVIREAR